jgi:hypothetical protein
LEVAQHPGIYHGQTFRSTLKLLEFKQGVATFLADESGKYTLSLRTPQNLTESIKAHGQADSLAVTYQIDENLPTGQTVVGEIKAIEPAPKSQETGPAGAAK